MYKSLLTVLLSLSTLATIQARGQELSVDSWGRHPVKIYINRHSDIYKFESLGVDVEELRDGYVEAAVTPEKLEELKASGWRVEPRIVMPVSPDIIQAYHNYSWLSSKLDSVVSNHPNIARKYSMGVTQGGRQQWAFMITDNPDSAENEAEVRFTATIHGDEPVGTEMCVGLIDSLTQHYGTVSAITDLVNSREIWFVPMYNPDGNTADSRYLDNGVDPNRNFPVPDGSIGGDGTYTNYAETQNFIDFWSNKRAVLSATFHGGALIANYPWDYIDSVGIPPCDPPDLFLARQVSLGYSRLNQPMYLTPSPSAPYDSGVIYGYTWYPSPGSLQDWSYHATSCLDVTMEISTTKRPSAGTLPTFWSDNRNSMLYFIRQTGWGVQGVVTDSLSGTPLNRVQVDVGGINKPVYTDSLAGDYHRMLMTGYYSLSFSKPGYAPKTFSNVRVKLDSVTSLNVQLSPLAPATLSGTVRDSSNGLPIGGAVVSLSESGSDTTGPDGLYSIATFQGIHTLTASAASYRTKVLNNVAVSGSTALDVYLAPMYSYNYVSHDTINIPDNGAWIEDSLYVDRDVSLADYEVYVNITHPYKGDLAVRVFSPTGDSLRLHQRTGGSADDIVGWYDSELTPADAARWTALVGQNALGFWRLRAKDFASSDVGRLNGWGLQIFSTDTGVNGGPSTSGTAPGLYLAGRPNPFASGTVITYNQPGPGPQTVELSVYNIAGQRVRTLASGLQSPAKYLMEWDGRDDQGRAIAAGVYLVRLSVNRRTTSTKMVAVR
jgi:subtilisin-like proprotein convertase family protein